jgi:sigma-B regulation protein RsbU (phosphoserine phosphatase)
MAETHGSTGMFATAFVGYYDPVEQLLHYVVAGHEAPLVLQGHQQQQLSVGGPAVGIFANATFQAARCDLRPGGLLLAFSDGLPDARDPDGASFGHPRIRAVLDEQSSQEWAAQALIDRFQQSVQAHMQSAEQFDDLTLLCLKVQA